VDHTVGNGRLSRHLLRQVPAQPDRYPPCSSTPARGAD